MDVCDCHEDMCAKHCCDVSNIPRWLQMPWFACAVNHNCKMID